MMQWVKSFIFNVQMYLAMAVIAVVFLPFALLSRRWALLACHTFCNWTIWTAGWMIGLKTEVRGEPPTGEVLIAAKHQSFFDIIVIFSAVPRPKFIMKKILLFSPILGQYAWRIGCIPVNRGKRGKAISQMVEGVKQGRDWPGQLIIYPQGTRVAPGAKRPYKVGPSILYSELEQPCVPVSTNIGVFWPKRGVVRQPGTAIVEFHPAIEPGMPKDEFMKKIEAQIETTSNALMAEAGFNVETDDA